MVSETQIAITVPPSSIEKISGGMTAEDFELVCQERNLEKIEITPKDIIQTIDIRHNAFTGAFEWHTHKIGEQVIGVLAKVLADMWRYYFKQPLRPKFTSGHARVLIDLDGDSLKIVYGLTDPANLDLPPVADAPVAKMMLVAALFGLCEKTDGVDFDPMSALTGITIE